MQTIRPDDQAGLDTAVRWSMISGWLTLPWCHLKFMPPLGMTRPLSAFFFTLAWGLLMVSEYRRSGANKFMTAKRDCCRERLRSIFGWQILRWWLFLIVLGVLSTAATPFYGNPLQALNRLLGYGLIFVFLYSALYSLRSYRMENIARWITLGYLPVLPYAVIEALATLKISWAYQTVMWVRTTFIVPQVWDKRTAFLTTEPSFLGFQLILLMAVFPFLESRPLRVINSFLILTALLFSKSGLMALIVLLYGLSYLFFSLKPKLRLWVATAGSLASVVLGGVYWLSSCVQGQVIRLMNLFASHSYRLNEMKTSLAIRGSYFMNLLYALFDTYGLGLGIGQYGHFWKEIYLRHIDYTAFDKYGNVAHALASADYMRPWSVILGVGVDLGIVGMTLLAAFLYQIFHFCRTRHARCIFMVGLLALLGAYPIVTPHVWLALGLMGGAGLLDK